MFCTAKKAPELINGLGFGDTQTLLCPRGGPPPNLFFLRPYIILNQNSPTPAISQYFTFYKHSLFYGLRVRKDFVKSCDDSTLGRNFYVFTCIHSYTLMYLYSKKSPE